MEVTAYHGTTSDRVHGIEEGGFQASDRVGLWLGRGRYFFQDGFGLAQHWAGFLADRRRSIEGGEREDIRPAVFKVRVRLGKCIDLLDVEHWLQLKGVYESNVKDAVPPQMRLVEYLGRTEIGKADYPCEDAATLGAYYRWFAQFGRAPDTIRASIPEGSPIFERSWLLDRTNIMINVLRPNAVVDFGRVG